MFIAFDFEDPFAFNYMNTSWARDYGKCSMVYKRLMLVLHSNEPFVYISTIQYLI
jgi:hypothetical protein